LAVDYTLAVLEGEALPKPAGLVLISPAIGIARLAAVIAAAGASIREIRHDRAFSGPEVFSTTVEVTVETADRDHVAALRQRLAAEGFAIQGP
jgi:alpha-beta hydrolase superfamily lysophospholipase